MISENTKKNDKLVSRKMKIKNILEGGDPNDNNATHGSILIEQTFSSSRMADFIEIIEKDKNIQNEIAQTIEKYIEESFSTRSQINQKVLAQSRVLNKAKNTISGTISDMDKKLE